jgi:hypothetical protein
MGRPKKRNATEDELRNVALISSGTGDVSGIEIWKTMNGEIANVMRIELNTNS